MSTASLHLDPVREVIADVLSLPGGAASLHAETSLFGSLPEFDSMSVIHLVGGLERRFGITIEDAEISAELFETVGSVVAFVARKVPAAR
jgi:acyl carrier protein